MKNSPLAVVSVAVFLLLASAPALAAQSPAGSPTQPSSVEGNRQALRAVCDEYWQAFLEHSPEFASEIGDKRYNDRITDAVSYTHLTGMSCPLQLGTQIRIERNP